MNQWCLDYFPLPDEVFGRYVVGPCDLYENLRVPFLRFVGAKDPLGPSFQ